MKLLRPWGHLSRLLLVLAVAGAAVLPATAGAKKARKPNILYIMSDDHAQAAISAYGKWLSKFWKTPHLDRLAREGVLFKNSLVTNSICVPSRAAMLTGQYSHRNGVYTLNDPLDPKMIHLAHLLKDLGYVTALFGKWHLQTDPTGFDDWTILPGQGQYINPVLYGKDDPKGKAKGKKGKGPARGKVYQGYSTDIITDMTMDYLKNRDKSKPFFVCCHYKAPHRPWDPAPRFEKLFEGKTIPEPDNLLDDYKGRAKVIGQTRNVVGEHMSARDVGQPIPKNLKGDELRRWAYQHYMKRYLACIAAVDENVGRLLDFLDKEGLAEDTIVVYTGDQGFFLGEHGWYDKRLMDEECLTTPLLVRYPGHTKPGTVHEAMVLNIDHAPTFLEFAGGKIPAKIQGRSYKALLDGSTPKDWRKSVYYRYWMHLDGSHNIPACYGVRTDRYTLVHYYGKGLGMKGARNVEHPPEWELFDRQKDPKEMRNVYADPAYRPVVAELRAELERLRKDLGDDR